MSHLLLLVIINLEHGAYLGHKQALGGLPKQAQHGFPAVQLVSQCVEQLQTLLIQNRLLSGLLRRKSHVEHHG